MQAMPLGVCISHSFYFSKTAAWKMWKTIIDLKTFLNCRQNNGKIYKISEIVYPNPPLHPNCRCVIERMKAILAGSATNNGVNGADWFL